MKGSYYLIDALQKLKNPERYFLVIFGPASDSFTSKVTLPFFASGYVANPAILSWRNFQKTALKKMRGILIKK
ncbi:MAG: hypothetical protein IJ530_04810 [Treponema sp.]|uniref:hypothetical protein n=1 Tax=Treponema sp. TaxID=166 RepID=UPI0025DFFB9E|nr:hypothetical protein [Treponema sp.]MBQ8679065.1 hypothetical protein [Treponema sp.]